MCESRHHPHWHHVDQPNLSVWRKSPEIHHICYSEACGAITSSYQPPIEEPLIGRLTLQSLPEGYEPVIF